MTRVLSALVNGGLLAALLSLTVWLILRRRQWNAATRYALWWAVLAITILLPFFFVGQASQPALPASAHASPSRIIPNLAISPLHEPVHPVLSIRAPIDRPLRMFTAWAILSTLLVLRLLLSIILLHRTSSRAVDILWPRPPIRRRVRIAASDRLSTPVAVGPFRPSILIPTSLLDQLASTELEQIVAHEAGHLARYDDLALLFQRLIEAIFFLHPVVRWIARRIDLEREIACDDLVIAATGRPRSYASCLTRMVEFGGHVRPSLAAAGAADDRSHLARRVNMLLDKTRHTGTKLLKTRLAAAIAMIAALAWIGGREGGWVAFAAPLVRTVRAIPSRIPVPILFAPQPAETAFTARVIEDSSGNPVRSAEVRFLKAGMAELAADLDTDKDGQVHSSGLPPGDYTVEVAKPNFITASLRLKIPGDLLLVRLVHYGVVSGHVLDQQGKPVPGIIHAPYGRAIGGARVALLARFEGSEQLRTVREAQLEEDGSYRIFDLTPGQYALGLWYDGIKEGSGIQLYPDNAHPRLFTVAGGEDYPNIDFTVLPQGAYRVSGKVAIQNPGKRNLYQLALSLPEQPALPMAQTLTEEDGSFKFDKIPAGNYDLLVGGPDTGYGARMSLLGRDANFARQRLSVSGNIENLAIDLVPAKSVMVSVRAAEGDTLPKGCPASLQVLSTPIEPWGLIFIGSPAVPFGKEGKIGNLGPGKFQFGALNLGDGCYIVKPATADLTSGEAAPVVIELGSAGQIHGSLRNASRPSDYVIVLLEGAAVVNGDTRLAFPDAKGQFTFDGLRPGKYRIAAQPATEARARWIADVARMSEIEVKGGAPTEIQLPVPAKGDRQ